MVLLLQWRPHQFLGQQGANDHPSYKTDEKTGPQEGLGLAQGQAVNGEGAADS